MLQWAVGVVDDVGEIANGEAFKGKHRQDVRTE